MMYLPEELTFSSHVVSPPTAPASLPRRIRCRLTATSKSLVLSFTSAFTLSSYLLAVISGLPAYSAFLSLDSLPCFLRQAVSWYILGCYFLTGVILARLFCPRPFDLDITFYDNVKFGSDLPSSVQEGDRVGPKPSVVYSDTVERSLLDLYCSIMAKSRFVPGSNQSSEWDSIPESSSRLDMEVLGLDNFAASVDIFADSVGYIADKWDSLPPPRS